MFSQKPSVAAWIQRCFRCTSPVWIAVITQSGLIEQDPHSSNFWNCSKWFRRGGQNCKDVKDDVLLPADGWNNVFVLDRAVHVPHGADACLTNSSFVDTFHVDLWNSRGNLEQRVQKRVRKNRVDLVQFGGQVTQSRGPGTQLSDFVDTKHVMSNNTDLQQCQIERGGEQNWKSAGDRSLSSWSCRARNHNLFRRMLQTWLGTSIVVVEECF